MRTAGPPLAHPHASAGLQPAAASKAGAGTHAGSRVLHTLLGAADEQGRRPYMEDRHTILPHFLADSPADSTVPRQFLAVYDGHSSHRGAEHAARRLHQILAQQPAIQSAKGDAREQAVVEQALKDAFLETDEEVVNKALDQGKRYGTTACCALRVGNVVYVAHAGDSRAVLCRGGRAIRLTQDHKPATVPEERKRIEAQGGVITEKKGGYVVDPGSNTMLNMSRALGDPDFKAPRRLVEAEPDVARVELQLDDDQLLLLASDGVFDVLDDQEAVEIALGVASKGRLSDDTAEAAADAVCRRALKAGSHDNITAVVMLMHWG